MLEDERLVWRMKRGDKEALRRIYEKYKDRLLTIAASMLSEPGGAEDILHDVFVSFAAGIRRFHLYGSLERYLTTCVVNRVRDRFRRKKFEVIEIPRVKQMDSGTERPEQRAMFDERSQVLAEALAQIPFEQREVVVLHTKAAMKFREIAILQGVGVSTVQGRYRYGLEKLRSALRGETMV
jgi:RNA polymerase sigma-70 factor (ECF subfamily)